jgi:prepilin-type N-terminal cleavage/methylation domain-containing protein
VNNAGRIQRIATRRTGFTLVEMLAVILIIGLLMTLVVGAFFRSRTVNKLLAAEQVIGDAIRQARHTARSTGAPVLLKISPTKRPDGSLGGGSISGVSRVWVWSEFFDHGQSPNAQGLTVGMSGNACLVNQGSPWIPPDLDRPLRFRAGDGAYIAVAVRPPLAGRTTEEVPKQIPLILVGGPDGSASGSSFGVMLVRSDAVDPRKITTQTNKGKRVKMIGWEILGWVSLGAATEPLYISSFEHLPNDLVRDEATYKNGVRDIADPLGGDRWEELGMLVTVDQVTLYRNGRRIAELRTGQIIDGNSVALPKILASADQIWVGQAQLPTGMSYAKCPIDDVRVYKLGTSEFGALPQGVYPMADPSLPSTTAVEYRLLAHPEGRVELSSAIGADTTTAEGAALNTDAALNTGTIFLGGEFTRSNAGGATRGANSAQVSVSIDGRLTSSLILAPEKSAPSAGTSDK